MVQGQIFLKDLLRTGRKELTLEDAYPYDDLPVTESVAVQAQLRLTATGATVTGKYKAQVEEPCDRCLEPFSREIAQSFQDRFVYDTFVDYSRSGEIALNADDFYDTIGTDSILDLKDLVYQHLIIAISNDRVCGKASCEFAHSTEGIT